MDFTEYQEKAAVTAVYPGQNSLIGLTYAALGLNGEAGELGELVKKLWRDEQIDLHGAVTEALTQLAEDLKSVDKSHHLAIHDAQNVIDKAFTQEMSEERRQKAIKELGDVLWYAAQVATELGVDLDHVAQANIDKLAARRLAGQIHGEGSDR